MYILKGKFPIEKFEALQTPFYYYDMKLLGETLEVIKAESGKYGYHVHYAVKANANPTGTMKEQDGTYVYCTPE